MWLVQSAGEKSARMRSRCETIQARSHPGVAPEAVEDEGGGKGDGRAEGGQARELTAWFFCWWWLVAIICWQPGWRASRN
jgi:hypothetical protein